MLQHLTAAVIINTPVCVIITACTESNSKIAALCCCVSQGSGPESRIYMVEAVDLGFIIGICLFVVQGCDG